MIKNGSKTFNTKEIRDIKVSFMIYSGKNIIKMADSAYYK